MKKFLTTILAFLYLATSADATITLHYCMGKLLSVDMVHKDACDKCGMKKAKGCCKDKVKVIKVQDSHQLISSAVAFHPQQALLPTTYNFFAFAWQPVTVISIIHNNSPPGNALTSLCILYCNFRI